MKNDARRKVLESLNWPWTLELETLFPLSSRINCHSSSGDLFLISMAPDTTTFHLSVRSQ